MSKKRSQLRRAELKRAERRKIMQMRNKQRNIKIMMAASVMLIAIIGIVVVMSMPNDSDDYVKVVEPAQPSGERDETQPPDEPDEPDEPDGVEFVIPLSDIGNNAKFYSYDAGGVVVRYFAVKGSDGDAHVAFDACDVCYKAKKGYRQQGDVMECINCGLTYPINGLGSENTGGGCWPSYLPMRIDGNDVVIGRSDLEQKKWMF